MFSLFDGKGYDSGLNAGEGACAKAFFITERNGCTFCMLLLLRSEMLLLVLNVVLC